jgi:hypothetical protein
MIKVGKILIDPNDISSIHLDMKSTPVSDRDRGFHIIQIIYKNGVVKNFTSAEIGMSYSEFIDSFLKIKEKEETDRIFRIMAAIKSANNG